MSAWTTWRLGDVAEARAGVGFPPALQGRRSGAYPFAKVGDVSRAARERNGELRDADNWVEEGDLKRLKARAFPAGTTAFAKIGEAIANNRRALAMCPVLLDNNAMGLVPDRTKIDPAFLFAFMQTVDLYPLASATTVPSLRKSDIENIEVSAPPIGEQRRIVAKLDALRTRSRRAKDALDAVPALLDRLRQSILAAAFRGDLTADWREQHRDVEPASELLKRVRIERRRRWEETELAKLIAKGKRPRDDAWRAKYVEPEPVDDTDLPELPEGWCWATLDELTDGGAPIVYGIIQPGPEVPTGVPFVRPTEMTDDGIDLSALHRCAPEVAAAYERARLTTNDVILAIVGTIGKVAEVPIELDGANITQSSARVRPAPALTPGFIAWALRSPLVRNQFSKYEFGNAVRRLNIAHVRVLAVPLAPLREQAAVLKRARAGIDAAQRIAAESHETRAALDRIDTAILGAAFRGELLPRNP